MPIDPNIPLQVQNIKLESPMNQLAMMGEAVKLGEMQRSVDTQNKLRELYSQGIDVGTPEGFKQVAALDPGTAIKLRADVLQGRKLEGDIKKTGIEVNQKTYDFAKQKMADLSFNPSDNNIKAHLEDGVLKGEVTPAQAKATWQQVSALNPEQRKAYFTELGVKVEERYKMNTISAAQQQTNATAIRGQNLTAETTRRGQDIGRIPVGYRQTNTGEIEPIPGGPTTTNLSPKEIQMREAKFPQANLAVKSFESKSDTVLKDIERLRNHPGLSSITGIAAGRLPGVTAQGREALELYEKVVAGLQFKELQDMRNASPTGGALGNVSNQEGTQLRQAAGALSRVQEKGSVQNELDQIAESIRGSKSRVREAFDMTYDYKGTPAGGGAPPSPPPSPPTGAGGNTVTIPGGKVLTFPTPEAAAAYKKAAGL
jgi:hypothetical protein